MPSTHSLTLRKSERVRQRKMFGIRPWGETAPQTVAHTSQAARHWCVVLICCTPIEIGARRKSRLFIWRAPAPTINISAALVNGVKIELLIKRARQTGLSDRQLLSCLLRVISRERERFSDPQRAKIFIHADFTGAIFAHQKGCRNNFNMQMSTESGPQK
jgi:hypothetical protein